MDILHSLQWVLPLRSPALTQFAVGFSWLGYTTFIIFFIAIGYWTWNKALFYRLLVLVAINALVNAYIKDLVQDPRPPLELRLDDLVGTSYGLPSAHSQMAVVMWLWLAWEVRRASLWVLCILIALGVMLSRMYLGVHDLEDVLVGAALGGASLFAFERLRRDHWPWEHSVGLRVLAIASVTGAALLAWPNGFTAPDYIPLVAGSLIAATWGMQWDKNYLRFSAPPQFWRKLAMGLVGTALFMGEQKLLKMLGPVVPLDPMLWAFVKGLANGICVAVLMPAVFVGLRLALPSAAPASTEPSEPPLSAAR